MLTIFTTLKPFRDPHISCVQRNAITSWTKLIPQCQIVLLGNDEGVSEIAKEFSLTHIPAVKTNKAGFPLIESLFSQAERRAAFSLLCYTNGDMIFLNDFLAAIKRINAVKKQFLAVGRRWDLDIKKPLDCKGNWQEKLSNLARTKGVLHGSSGIDYFVFPKGTYPHIPSLVVGRAGWDNWMIFNAHSRRVPVIDITSAATVIHQNHDAPGTRENAKRFNDESAQKNIELAGGHRHFLTVYDADTVLTPSGLHPTPFLRFIASLLSLPYYRRLAGRVYRKIFH